jgi:peptidoglycan/LPS O-acetylase OafA/YrhL
MSCPRGRAVRSPLEHAVAPSFGRRLTGIEGVRALAASTILVYHVWLYASPGDEEPSVGYGTRFLPDLAFGVVLFFTLSGFLLYRPFVSSLLRGETRPSFSNYLRNRALRILPAYWVILLLTSFVLQSALVRDANGRDHHGMLDDPSLLVRNGLLVSNYEPDGVLTGIGPAWSLAVEVVFYLTLPLLVLLGFALARHTTTRAGLRLAALIPPVVLLAVGLAGKAAAAYLVPATTASGGWGHDWHTVLERSFVSQADLFTFGMVLAVVHVEAENRRLQLGRWRWAVAAGALGAYLVTAKMTSLGQLGHSPFNTLMAVAAALFLALVVLRAPGGRKPVLTRVLEARPLVWVGLVSYSLFLWHEPVIYFLADNGFTVSGSTGFLVNLLVVAAVTLVLSSLTYLLVEKPALMLKRRRRERPPASVQASATEERVESAPGGGTASGHASG